jgi:esterase/lipase
MKKLLWLVLGVVLVWVGGNIYVLRQAPKSLFVESQRERSRAITDFPLSYEQVFVQNNVGEKIEMILAPNPNNNNVILYFHGNSGRIPELMAEASRVSTVVSPSYPGYSQSEGQPSEDAVYGTVHTAMQYLKDRGYEEPQITVLGHSLGGTAAVYAGEKYPGIHKLVLVNTLNSVYSLCVPKYSVLCTFTHTYFNSGSRAKHIIAPTRVFHDEGDTVIPFTQGQKLFENIKSGDKKFETLAGTHSEFDVATVLAE